MASRIALVVTLGLASLILQGCGDTTLYHISDSKCYQITISDKKCSEVFKIAMKLDSHPLKEGTCAKEGYTKFLDEQDNKGGDDAPFEECKGVKAKFKTYEKPDGAAVALQPLYRISVIGIECLETTVSDKKCFEARKTQNGFKEGTCAKEGYTKFFDEHDVNGGRYGDWSIEECKGEKAKDKVYLKPDGSAVALHSAGLFNNGEGGQVNVSKSITDLKDSLLKSAFMEGGDVDKDYAVSVGSTTSLAPAVGKQEAELFKKASNDTLASNEAVVV